MMGGETLEIDKAHLRQYAHFGYVHCMLLVRGASRLVGVDEDMLISGGGDGTIKLWQLSSDPDHGISELTQLGEDDAEGVLSLALDGSFLYSGKVDGIIELWDLDTKQKLRVIKAHKGDIMTLQMGWGILWSAGSTGFARVGASSWNSYALETNIIRRNTAPYNMVNIATTRRHSRRSTSVWLVGRAMKVRSWHLLASAMQVSNYTLPVPTIIRFRFGLSKIASPRPMAKRNHRKTCS